MRCWGSLPGLLSLRLGAPCECGTDVAVQCADFGGGDSMAVCRIQFVDTIRILIGQICPTPRVPLSKKDEAGGGVKQRLAPVPWMAQRLNAR